MNSKRLITTLAICALAGFIAAQKPEDEEFKDLKGNLRIWHMKSHLITFKEKGAARFEASGTPVMAESKLQGLKLEMLKLDADLEPAGGGSMVLRQATADGKTVAIKTLENGTVQTLKTEKLLLVDTPAEAKLTIPTAFDFKVKGPKADVDLNANNGVITFDSFRVKGKGELKTGTLRGDVKVHFTGKSSSHGTLTSQSVDLTNKGDISVLDMKSPFDGNTFLKTTNGSRDMTFSGTSGILNLKRVDRQLPEGEDPLLSADINGPINIKIIDVQEVEREGKKVTETRTITAQAAEMHYSLETRKIRLSKSVKYRIEVKAGDEEPIGGTGESSELELTLDAKGNVVDYKASSGHAEMKGGGKKK